MALAKGDAGTAATIHKKEVSLSVHKVNKLVSLSVHEVDKLVINHRTNCRSIWNVCSTYHSHFRKVEESIFCEVWCTFLNKREVSEVHAQVRYAGRITAM